MIDTNQIPVNQRCLLCGVKWRQGSLGLCRKCQRSSGADARSIFERERDKVALEKAHQAALRQALENISPASESLQTFGPKREVVVGDVTYVVLWDGSRPYDAINFR